MSLKKNLGGFLNSTRKIRSKNEDKVKEKNSLARAYASVDSRPTQKTPKDIIQESLLPKQKKILLYKLLKMYKKKTSNPHKTVKVLI